MIDFHVHIGNLRRDRYPHIPLSAPQWIDRMDRESIDLSVLLPLESPEGAHGYFTTEEACAARDMYPERFVAFLCIDPRMPSPGPQIDHFVNHCGCMGFGEHINGLAFDDDRNRAVYAKCDEYGLPLVFENNNDTPQLSALESCVKEFQNVTWVGHGPGFWAAISGDWDGSSGYPKGPIAGGGAVDRLLSRYENVFADLSAQSAYNAMTRDPGFAAEFIQRHWRRLLWGSDVFYQGQPIPQLAWLRQLDLDAEIKQAIADGNARRLLGLSG